MGKYKSFILLGIAVFLSLVATILIINWLQTKGKVKEAVPIETADVAVAKTDLNWGTVLGSETIETKPFLKESLPKGYFSNLPSLTGRVLIFPVKAGEPIFESKLAPTTIKTGGVAAIVSPKKRAVAVKVDKVIGVSGFIHPGNRVDVLVTLATEKTSAPVSKTVLENILVLAVGPETEIKGKEVQPSPVDVITLEVTSEEAEKLALAATEGRILLVLRNLTDTEDVLTKGMTIPVLLASYSSQGSYVAFASGKGTKAVPRKVVATKKPSDEQVQERKATPEIPQRTVAEIPPKPVFVVELIKGSNVTGVKFEGRE